MEATNLHATPPHSPKDNLPDCFLVLSPSVIIKAGADIHQADDSGVNIKIEKDSQGSNTKKRKSSWNSHIQNSDSKIKRSRMTDKVLESQTPPDSPSNLPDCVVPLPSSVIINNNKHPKDEAVVEKSNVNDSQLNCLYDMSSDKALSDQTTEHIAVIVDVACNMSPSLKPGQESVIQNNPLKDNGISTVHESSCVTVDNSDENAIDCSTHRKSSAKESSSMVDGYISTSANGNDDQTPLSLASDITSLKQEQDSVYDISIEDVAKKSIEIKDPCTHTDDFIQRVPVMEANDKSSADDETKLEPSFPPNSSTSSSSVNQKYESEKVNNSQLDNRLDKSDVLAVSNTNVVYHDESSDKNDDTDKGMVHDSSIQKMHRSDDKSRSHDKSNSASKECKKDSSRHHSSSTKKSHSSSQTHRSNRWHHSSCDKMKSDRYKCTCPTKYNERIQVNITELSTHYVQNLPANQRDPVARQMRPRMPWLPHETTMKLKYQQYFRVTTDLNGGSTVCHLYWDEISSLDTTTIKEIAEEFIKLSYQENSDGNAHHVIGIVHNGAQYLPDLIDYMADHYGSLSVEIGSLKGPGNSTTTMSEYRHDVYKTYNNGTFRYPPLQAVTLCGTRGEEKGAYFPDFISRLEASPFLKPVMPWGKLSAARSCKPMQSNDGPIIWIRPGEQTIPASDASRSQGRMQKGASRLTEERAALFEDRTKPHTDHSGSYKDGAVETVCAVGLLRAVTCGHTDHKGRTTKDVIAFNASQYEKLKDVLQLDPFEPPLTQCMQWLDVARLNMLRRQGIEYAHVQLNDGDVYYLPRKVVHQFQTVSAVSSIAWHIRYYKHCEPLRGSAFVLNKGSIYREKANVLPYVPPQPADCDTYEEETIVKTTPRKNRRRSESERKLSERKKTSKPVRPNRPIKPLRIGASVSSKDKITTDTEPKSSDEINLASTSGTNGIVNTLSSSCTLVDDPLASKNDSNEDKLLTNSSGCSQCDKLESIPKSVVQEPKIVTQLEDGQCMASEKSTTKSPTITPSQKVALSAKSTTSSQIPNSSSTSSIPGRPSSKLIKKRIKRKPEPEQNCDVLGSIMEQMKKSKYD